MQYKEAYNLALEYFDGDTLATEVFFKYALMDDDGNILEPTPKEMFKRLASELHRIETNYPNPLSYEEIYDLLDGFKKVVAQGSPMSAIGNPYQIQSTSNCVVIASPMDSYPSILRADQDLVNLSKRRCGVGLDISAIRPRGAPTANAAKTTDGIGVFMERFSNSIREVGQSGRRGALMITVSVHHPEIETFIDIKKDRKKVTGANVSIKASREFMEAVIANKDFQLRWPVNSSQPKISKMVSAKALWTKMCQAARDCAEPGIIFEDTIIENSLPDCYEKFGFKTISTNPCGEIPLSAYDSCRLMLMNTLSYVKNPFQHNSFFDFEEFEKDVFKAQKLMDDLVDLELESIDKILEKINSDPEPYEEKRNEINLWNSMRKTCQQGRRTGLGVTAIGDCLAALGLKYGSEESIAKTEEIYKSLAISAHKSSCMMAKDRGPFPIFQKSLEEKNPHLNRLLSSDSTLKSLYDSYGRRNIALTTTAPAGSVSILTQTTSGIEPVFKLSYKRRRKINPGDKMSKVDFIDQSGDRWQEYEVFHRGYNLWKEKNPNKSKEQSPYFGAEANDINSESGVKLQAAAQRWIDHAISRTQNLPEDVSLETVMEIYLNAYKQGCKGFTIYREGSRDGVLLDASQKQKTQFSTHSAPKRPSELECEVHHMTVDGNPWTIFVGLFDKKPYEVFAGLSKAIKLPKRVCSGKIVKIQSSDDSAVYNFHYDYDSDESETVIRDISSVFENPTDAAFTRIVSLALRHGADARFVVEQIVKGADKDSNMFSLSKAISRVLKKYIKDGEKISNKKCSSCQSSELEYSEGCIICRSCGYSKCG